MKYLKRIWKYLIYLWETSWTIRILKSPYAPIIISILAILFTICMVKVYVISESWWTKQIFIAKAHITWDFTIKTAEAKEDKNPADMTTEEYICYVFGKDCKLALAVSQAENGTRQCDRYNQNTNGTRDWGIFQVNEIHLKKPGWSLSDLTDCKKNVDRAFEIYEAQGFNPWVAYKNKSYQKFLK